MIKTFMTNLWSEPFRLFFPVGILSLLYGILLWIPLIWDPGIYPVTLHRYLVLNGFVASFIAGFLMTAVPRFSKTFTARPWEVGLFLVITGLGVVLDEPGIFYISALQVLTMMYFLFSRILQRKENPPYSFVFIFVGLFLWLIAALGCALVDAETFKQLHYEGAIAAIILGVGSRLIPGILGHVQIVSAQRAKYEKPASILSTVPWHFYLLIVAFVVSYFLNYPLAEVLRSAVVLIITLIYWRLYTLPRTKTALTFCIWFAGWMIVTGFMLKMLSQEGAIHYSHAFFINGIVLLSLLVGTRVLQSHGPKDNKLEDWKGLYIVTIMIFIAAATRVSAYLMPEVYLTHLAYSSLTLSAALVIWSFKYLRFSLTVK